MGKKKKKKRGLEGESIIDHLGGEEQMKIWGTSLMMFANMVDKLIIVDDMSSSEVRKRCDKIMKLGEDMRKGKDDMLDQEAVFRDVSDDYDSLPFV